MSVAQREGDTARPRTGFALLQWVAGLRRVREFNVFAALIAVGALISLFTPYFLTTDNLMGVFRSFSMTAIMSIGMVMVIKIGRAHV